MTSILKGVTTMTQEEEDVEREAGRSPGRDSLGTFSSGSAASCSANHLPIGPSLETTGQ